MCEYILRISITDIRYQLTSVVHVEDVGGVGTGGHPADERSNAVVLHG